MDVDLLEDLRHHLLMHLGWLVGIGQRGAIDELIGFEFPLKQGWGVGFVDGVFAPVLPVVRFKAGLDAHGGHITIATAVCAVAGWCKGMGETGFGQEAGDGRQDAPRLCVVDW